MTGSIIEDKATNNLLVKDTRFPYGLSGGQSHKRGKILKRANTLRKIKFKNFIPGNLSYQQISRVFRRFRHGPQTVSGVVRLTRTFDSNREVLMPSFSRHISRHISRHLSRHMPTLSRRFLPLSYPFLIPNLPLT